MFTAYVVDGMLHTSYRCAVAGPRKLQAFNPPPVAPTMVLPVATLPRSMSTNPTGAPTGPLNSSATAVQSSPIVTVPAPPAHDVGTPPVFAATIQSVPSTSYAPVVPFAPTILSPAATCAGIVPGQ